MLFKRERNMLRKTIGIAVGALILANSASLHAGVYVGAGVGSDTVDFTMRARVTRPNASFAPDFDVINKAHLSATGIFGTLFVGINRVYNNIFYLAAEINGNLSTTASTGFNREFVNGTFSDTSIKIKNSLGISLLPGYQFTPNTLFYGRLGLTNSEFKVNTSDISLANFSKRRNGFRYGLGIQQSITQRLAVRMDYSRINYKSIKTDTLDPLGGVTKENIMSANQQLIEFGVVFKFDQPIVVATK